MIEKVCETCDCRRDENRIGVQIGGHSARLLHVLVIGFSLSALMPASAQQPDVSVKAGNKPPVTRHSVQTPSGRISYTEQGTGPVALFVHGVLLNGICGAISWRICPTSGAVSRLTCLPTAILRSLQTRMSR
jgi:hypothetical protein